MYIKETERLKFFEVIQCIYFSTWKTIIHLKRNSDLDIAFNDNTTDDEFLQTIASNSKLIETQNSYLFYLVGVDILVDKLGAQSKAVKETNWF
jgi:acetoin utilization deacetylase AcuC-like enzyme